MKYRIDRIAIVAVSIIFFIFIARSGSSYKVTLGTCYIELGEDTVIKKKECIKAFPWVMAGLDIDMSKVNMKKAGTYEASIMRHGKETKDKIIVVVEDTKAPEGGVKEDVFTLKEGENIKALDCVKDISDASLVTAAFILPETDITDGNEQVAKEYTFNEQGSYTMNIQLLDTYGNEKIITAQFFVESEYAQETESVDNRNSGDGELLAEGSTNEEYKMEKDTDINITDESLTNEETMDEIITEEEITKNPVLEETDSYEGEEIPEYVEP